MKKILCIILTLAMLLSFAACGQAANDSAPASAQNGAAAGGQTLPDNAAESGESVWTASVREIYPAEAGYNVKYAAKLDGRVLFWCTNGDEGFPALSSYTVDGGTADVQSAVRLDISVPENERLPHVYALTAGADGCFYILCGELPPVYLHNDEMCFNNEFSGRYCLIRLDADGKLLGCTGFTYEGSDSQLHLLAADADGRVFVADAENRSSLFTLGSHGELNELDIGDMTLLNISVCGDALMLYGIVYDMPDIHAGWAVMPADGGEPEYIRQSEYLSMNAYSAQGLDGEFICNDGAEIGTLDISSGEYTPFVKWSAGEHSAADIYSMVRLSEDCFLCTLRQCRYAVLLGREALDLSGRTIVRAANVSGSYGTSLADAFNAADPDYYIVAENYDQDSVSRLLTEIGAGNAPDLVIGTGLMDTSSSAFADLYKFIDADSELSRADFVPHLLESLESRGELHEIYTSFMLYTIAARTCDIGEVKNYSVDELEELFASSGRKYMFEPWMSAQNLLGWVCSAATVEFIDPGTGTCHFSDPAFIKLLEWCRDAGPDYSAGEIYAGPEYTQDEAMLFLEQVSTPLRITSISSLGDYAFIGFPGSTKGNGAYFDCLNSIAFAIPAQAKEPDGAWAFIRRQLTLSAQLRSDMDLPVNMEALKRQAADALEGADYDKFIDLVSNASGLMSYAGDSLRSIIYDSGKAFLAGDKTAAETAAVIQSRASVYLAEKAG